METNFETLGMIEVSFTNRRQFLKKKKLPEHFRESKRDCGKDPGFQIEITVNGIKALFWALGDVDQCYPSFYWGRDRDNGMMYVYAAAGRSIAYLHLNQCLSLDAQKTCRNVFRLAYRLFYEWQNTGKRRYTIVVSDSNRYAVIGNHGEPIAYLDGIN